MNSSKNSFFKLVNHPLKFRLFLFYKLPAAFFSGIKVREIKEDKCVTSVPYKWLTQNPFKSTYFASLAMAAEMSTGVLALCNVYKRKPAVSMLVTKMEAAYFKKATGTIFFTCEQGMEMSFVIEEAVETGGSKNIVARSTGKNNSGEIVAEFLFTWSFKAKPIQFKV
ncbi:MAG: DUF4442 domain-containing protein [Bacteroidota bacterium]|nr:DUF4442 domain-containing protein [Bacteroidota bacterium]